MRANNLVMRWWLQLGPSQRPAGYEPAALPLSYATRKKWQAVMDSNHRNVGIKTRCLGPAWRTAHQTDGDKNDERRRLKKMAEDKGFEPMSPLSWALA